MLDKNRNINGMDIEQQKYIGNTVAGLAGGTAVFAWLPNKLQKPVSKLNMRSCSNFTIREQHEIWDAAKKTLENMPIKDNVQFIDITERNWEPVADNIVEKRRVFLKNNKNPFIKLISKTWPNDARYKEMFRVYAEGKNACFMPATSQLLVNRDKMGSAAFHELGHAMNAKGIGEGRILAKIRGKAKNCVPLVFLISMLTPKDREDSKTKNPVYKTLLNFKKYAGLIAALCMLPMVAEEGLASIKGSKMAKKVLSPELCKRINKVNTRSFMSYTTGMILVGIGMALANYVKDKVTGPLPAKKKTNETPKNQELIAK